MEFLVGMLLWLSHERNKNGYQIALNSFIDSLAHKDDRYNELEITAQAFSKARRKLPFEVLENLCTETAKMKHLPSLKFKGLEVIALDGSGFSVPDTEELNEHFNKHRTYSTEAYLPQGNMVVAVHTRSKTISHAVVDCLHSSEKNLAGCLIENFESNTLFLLDRGLATHNIFKKIFDRGQHFLARVRTDHQAYRPFRNFYLSGKKEHYLALANGVALRLARVKVPQRKEPIILATTLPESFATIEQLGLLYAERWEVETVFDLIKNIHNLEQFHARDFNGVMQEIYAHFTLHNITAACGPQEITENGLLNRKSMLDLIGRKLLCLFIIGKNIDNVELRWLVDQVQKIAEKSRKKRRPNRRHPRISKQPKKKWNEGKHRTKELQEFRSLS